MSLSRWRVWASASLALASTGGCHPRPRGAERVSAAVATTLPAPLASASGTLVAPPSDEAFTSIPRGREVPFRGHIGNAPIVLWLRQPYPPKREILARFYYEPFGEDARVSGDFDGTGRFTLEDRAGANVFEGTWRVGEPLRGVHRGAAEEPFELNRVVPVPGADFVPIVPRRLHREMHQGTYNHCVVDVEYFEIVGGLDLVSENVLNAAINPEYYPPGGECVRGVRDTQRALVHTNGMGVLSFEFRRLLLDDLIPTDKYDAYDQLFCVAIPSGYGLSLGDILKYVPGTPSLPKLLEPYFRKALGGDAKKARQALKNLDMYTDHPHEAPECLLDPDGVRFLWAYRNQAVRGTELFPTPEGIRIPFEDLVKLDALNRDGPLNNFFANIVSANGSAL